MNFVLTTTMPAPAEGPDLLPAPAEGAGPSAVSAFLDMLGLLDVAVAPAASEPGATGGLAQEDTADDGASAAMPAMAAMPAQLLMTVPVAMPAAAPAPLPKDLAEAPIEPAAVGSPTGPQRMATPVMPPAADTPAVATRPDQGVDGMAPSPVRAATAASAPADAARPTEFRLDDVRTPAAIVAAHAPAAARDLPAVTLSPATPAQWRQPLAEALGDRLQLTLQRGSEQAVIRLDPPQLGRIEIAIRHEAGSIQVHLSATHGEVVRQLNAIGDSLRQDLGQRAQGDVSVVVSDSAMGRDAEGRSRGRPQQPEDTGPNRALAEAESGTRLAFRLGHETSDIR